MDDLRTESLRRTTLTAWAAAPARFREDANAEEDLALGGYRDRLVVELAQNAADAAARAGAPGRILFRLSDEDDDGGEGTLTAANTGTPLDNAGVESLSTLRASAKRDEADQSAVGRFGVGFSAVRAVSDAPAVIRADGTGVRWSLMETRRLTEEAAAQSPGLADEMARRDGHLPVLRLPLPAQGAVPEGYDTAVVLPFRDTTARDLAVRLLDGIDDALLLALPGVSEVVVESPRGRRVLTRTEDRVGLEGAEGTEAAPYIVIHDTTAPTPTRWRTATASGHLAPALLADRPIEERLRPTWSVTWAVPVDDHGAPAAPRTAPVVHAPTPTDEPLGLPALLIASFPLEPTRRHAAPGPLADFVVRQAAEAYARLLRDWRPLDPAVLDLVPGPLGQSELDAALRTQILDLLPETPFLPPAAPGPTAPDLAAPGPAPSEQAAPAPAAPQALRPRDAILLEGASAATVAALADVYPNLLPAGQERRQALRTLAVQRLPLAEAIESLAGTERPPAWWHRLYDSLAGTDPEALGGLPVPLADGRTVTGPRQVLLPLPDSDSARIARLGLRVAHPEAAHPLLEKLGATPATPRAVLTTPQVRAAVAASLDEDEAWHEDEDQQTLTPDELADTVLALARDAHLAPGDEPWLAALALPDEDGELAPAGELVYPGSPFEQVIREGELAACDAELANRWGEQPLTAVGVQATFALVRAADVVLDPDELEPRDSDYPEPDDPGLLDAVDVWCEDVLDRLDEEPPVPPVITELIGVRDLDLVADDAWPQALAMLAQPPLRDALTQPARILLPDGGTQQVRPYTAWWLRGNPVLDGRRPAGLRAAGGDPLLAGLYEPADTATVQDDQVLRALGVRTSAAALLDEPGGAAELLSRLADPDLPVTAPQLHALYGLLAALDPEQVTLPDDLRAVVDGDVRVVDAGEALVADAPDLVPLAAGRPLLPVRPAAAADLAELLQVSRLSEAYEAPVSGPSGERRDVPEPVRTLLGPATPVSYEEHDELIVNGVELDWRRTPDGTLHAATLEGVAAGLAWAAGQWPRRFEAAALLEDLSRAEELAQDRWFD